MSSGAVESPQELAHIAVVDVDASTREDGSECELSCDSGLGSKSACPIEAALPSEVTLSPSKSEESGIKVDIKMESELFHGIETPPSLSNSSASSPDANTSDNFSNLDDFITNLIESSNQNEANNEDKAMIQNVTDTSKNNEIASIPTLNESEITVSNDSVDQPGTYLEANKSLATSTVSLHETTNTNITICKSPYSRSAENISIDVKLDQSNVDQKNKVSATHVIPPDTQTNLDVRYPRIPKEILSQDLGSIVKNVHGIFSSVSGSLKSAYTYRAGQLPYMKTVKPMPNGKLMNDIFEDEQNDEKVTNGIEALKTEPSNELTTEVIEPNQISNVEENDVKGDVLRLQVESLERLLGEQRRENGVLRERVKQQADELQERDQTFKELEVKIDLMSKRVEQAEREKDAAVMRYAGVECSAIEARRAADAAAKAERAALAETELLSNKIRAAREDKQRICQLYDDKCHELQNSERELSKAREDAKELEGRLKWTQSKLRMEMDAYKDSAERVEKLSAQVSELEAARDAAAASAGDSLRAKQLESELKESQAALILCRHEREDLERRLAAVTLQLDASRAAAASAAAARDAAAREVEALKESNQRLEEEAAELASLRAQAALADTLSAQLQRETERAAQAEEALGRERARAETCARREAGALEHAARLTAQHVAERARASHAASQAQALSADNVSLRERVATLEAEGEQLRAARADEAERRRRESRVLARKVAELQEEAAEAGKRLEWEQGENAVLKKKHASAVKELNRELQRALKRCEQLEAKLPPPDAPSTRTGSITSLSSSESAPHDDRLQNGHSDVLPEIQEPTQFNTVREPDKQALIERIVSLQRAAARRAERCDFLEEHSRQLTDELRTKARLLRHLLPALPAQALANSASDSNKKEIARHGGGAMAALWGGDPAGLTLELSLEMNKRLQAVLEDTLLKNITLKENMDTLGEEIARLKGQRNSTPDSK